VGLFCEFAKPIFNGGDTAWLYRGEADSHPRSLACIDHRSLRSEGRPVVRYSESDFGSVRERRHRLNKTPEQVQVLCVGSDLCSGVESGQMNSGDERKALSAMALERDGEGLKRSVELYAMRRNGRTAAANDGAC
jgi:hypothetical protein